MKVATKIDSKRALGTLYRPARTPEFVDVPEMTFLMIDGAGDPNKSAAFEDAIGALYSASFTAKFMLREHMGIDYMVMPLEGLWWSDDPVNFQIGNTAEWKWTMMIAQPDSLTPELFDAVIAKASLKTPTDAIANLRLERFNEGRCAQLMHIGPYDTEGPSIALLHDFVADHGYLIHGKHHEIYLGDPRRSAPETLRTVLRQPVMQP